MKHSLFLSIIFSLGLFCSNQTNPNNLKDKLINTGLILGGMGLSTTGILSKFFFCKDSFFGTEQLQREISTKDPAQDKQLIQKLQKKLKKTKEYSKFAIAIETLSIIYGLSLITQVIAKVNRYDKLATTIKYSSASLILLIANLLP